MKIAIMQPYFMPYIGYFQLINAVDRFVIYDDIQYTKKGWINRNRILQNNEASYITLPLKKGSDYLDVKDRFLAESWLLDKHKLLNKIKSNYRKSPYYAETIPLVENILAFKDHNLFKFIHHSIILICAHLNITTEIVVSSELMLDRTLKSQNRVLNICNALNATNYINLIGGVELYQQEMFEKQNIKLNFLQAMNCSYTQFSGSFSPWLSIIDMLMFNSLDKTKEYLIDHFIIK